uniref:Periplasmic binding protein-like I n=1 Tax=Helianthus annuus TaxID=4232 RepID=A0A251VNG5_HELAN
MKLQNLSKIISLVLIFVSLLYHGLCTHSLLPQNSSTFLFDKVIIRVGIILDMEAWTGKSIHSFINFAISDFYTRNSNYRTRIVLHIRDSKGDPLQALSAECLDAGNWCRKLVPEIKYIYIAFWRFHMAGITAGTVI